MRDPSHLGRKAFNMVFFLLQQAFRYRNRHRDVFMSGLFEHTVQRLLHVFPQRLRVRAHNNAALDRGIVDHLRFFHDIGVPLRNNPHPWVSVISLTSFFCSAIIVFPHLFQIDFIK